VSAAYNHERFGRRAVTEFARAEQIWGRASPRRTPLVVTEALALRIAHSAATAADEACAHSSEPASSDRLVLDGAERVAEVPAVEPGTA
jgi:hypothetical protein